MNVGFSVQLRAIIWSWVCNQNLAFVELRKSGFAGGGWWESALLATRVVVRGARGELMSRAGQLATISYDSCRVGHFLDLCNGISAPHADSEEVQSIPRDDKGPLPRLASFW